MQIEVTILTDDSKVKVFRALQSQHFCRNGIHRAFITYKRRILPVAMREGKWIGYI